MSYFPQTKGDQTLVVVALAVFAVTFYSLWNYQPLSHGPGTAEWVGDVVTDNPVRRRHAGTLAWSAIEKEGGIYFRDIVYTPVGVHANVRLKNGQVIPLPEDSLVQFDEVTVSNIEIALRETAKKKDVFRLLPMPKGTQSRFLPDPLSLEMLLDELAGRTKKMRVQQAPLEKLTTVRMPRVTLKLDTLADYQLKLLKPVDKGMYSIQRGSWFQLSWTAVPVPGARYVLEIARNPEFRRKLPFTAISNGQQVMLRAPGVYYWRVRALAGDQILTSGTRSFTISLQGGSVTVRPKGGR